MQETIPIAKNTRLQQKDENHTLSATISLASREECKPDASDIVVPYVLLTETWLRFSLIQEGTVVTKPKLNRTVPSTPAPQRL